MFPSPHPRHRRHNTSPHASPALSPPQTIPPLPPLPLPHAQVHHHYHPITMRKTAELPTHSTSSDPVDVAFALDLDDDDGMNNKGHAADADSSLLRAAPSPYHGSKWSVKPHAPLTTTMSRTLFTLPTTLAKYDVFARAQRPRLASITSQPRPCSPSLLGSPTLTLPTSERLVEPHPHWIGSPHDSSRYQDYLRAALAPDVHKMPPAALRTFCRGPGGPRGPCLSGHQHPTEHAIDPKNAVGECARDPGGS
ncbi:hypothetical protein EDB86DRAFT_3109244 [Lactarius hatsudake]|nr:hypothetical protein EDB86DRAFT_3109244 [Lactarius hatsudake]